MFFFEMIQFDVAHMFQMGGVSKHQPDNHFHDSQVVRGSL